MCILHSPLHRSYLKKSNIFLFLNQGADADPNTKEDAEEK